MKCWSQIVFQSRMYITVVWQQCKKLSIGQVERMNWKQFNNHSFVLVQLQMNWKQNIYKSAWAWQSEEKEKKVVPLFTKAFSIFHYNL